MKLAELLKETDALAYINALKVTLTEIKQEVSTQEELREYQNQSAERMKKLMRKADNQYRLVAKCAQQGEITIANDVIIQDASEIEDLMKEVD